MRNVNIKDVAKEAGVAVSTVSRVINNHNDVKKETKEHVLRVIKELNYIPNNSARNLKRIITNDIGVFILGEYNPFFGAIVETLENEISSRGYSVILHYHHNYTDGIEAASQFISEKKLLGLIYLGGVVSKDKEGYLEGLEVPTIFVSSIVEEDVNKDLFSSIVIDERSAVRDVVDYFVELGHKKMGIITAETIGLCVSPLRFSAFKDILKEYNIDFKDEYSECGDYSIKSGFDSMTRLLEKSCDITCVFVVNDLMAIGAIKAVVTKGLEVPRDISVIGFDGLDYGEYFIPSLTTIKQPNFDFVKQSSGVLFDMIEKNGKVKHIVLETEFIKRDSCRSIKE